MFRYGNSLYDIDAEDVRDERGRTHSRRWLVKKDGVVEHTFRALGNESRHSVEQRAIQAIESTSLGAVRELDFTYGGRRYHLEDWSNAVSKTNEGAEATWCVTCDGVMEGSFSSAFDETESVLRHRAVEIVLRSGVHRSVADAPQRKSRRAAYRSVDEENQSASGLMLIWITFGLFMAWGVSLLVQSVLFGAP